MIFHFQQQQAKEKSGTNKYWWQIQLFFDHINMLWWRVSILVATTFVSSPVSIFFTMIHSVVWLQSYVSNFQRRHNQNKTKSDNTDQNLLNGRMIHEKSYC